MKYLLLAARYLLGLLFTITGLNGFLHFMPMGTVPPMAGQFLGALVQSHYMDVIFALQLAGGLLLLATRYLPLAAVVLGPIVVNIVLFHTFLAPAGLPLALFALVLWAAVAYSVREPLSSLWKPLQRRGGVDGLSDFAAVPLK